ncbi:MAG: chemotaxis protein CheW [Gammaproteobacteria bacterium]|nr:chemotaxis protein CheW [Gammaproteobacteria bacterium]
MAQTESIVRTQIIPLTGMSLVLPNTSIAEVINYSTPSSVKGSPDWYLGMVSWRGINIPLVSFEKANEVKAARKSKLTRIAVLNGVSGNDKLSFYGVVVQGIPRLASLDESSIQEIANPTTKLPLALSQATVADQDAVIPDQIKIEKLLKQAGAEVSHII